MREKLSFSRLASHMLYKYTNMELRYKLTEYHVGRKKKDARHLLIDDGHMYAIENRKKQDESEAKYR